MDVSVAEWLAWLTSNCGRIGAIVSSPSNGLIPNMWGQKGFNPLCQCVYIYVCIVNPDIQTIHRCSHTSIHTYIHDTYTHTYKERVVIIYFVYFRKFINLLMIGGRKEESRRIMDKVKTLIWIYKAPFFFTRKFIASWKIFLLYLCVIFSNGTKKHFFLFTSKQTSNIYKKMSFKMSWEKFKLFKLLVLEIDDIPNCVPLTTSIFIKQDWLIVMTYLKDEFHFLFMCPLSNHSEL